MGTHNVKLCISFPPLSVGTGGQRTILPIRFMSESLKQAFAGCLGPVFAIASDSLFSPCHALEK